MIRNKFYMYYVLKSIRIIKEYWWYLTLSWPDEIQIIFFWLLVSFKRESKPHTFICFIVYKLYNYIFVIFHLLVVQLETHRLLIYFDIYICIFIFSFFFSFLTESWCTHIRSFLPPYMITSFLISERGGAGDPFLVFLRFK